jgi:thioredoxin-related protein
VFSTEEEFQEYIIKNFETIEVFIEKYNGWVEMPLL